ncbi:YjbF family lipoprotein [Aliidiomarina celeris]|uniref:YjbF family lipoprotein n=1 Tax=Aliidiomarina celeris TaxID=2249428 RepID=UPI000DEB28B7|nr:YjbF family lipoprotein [Aliidiomarina celeris]
MKKFTLLKKLKAATRPLTAFGLASIVAVLLAGCSNITYDVQRTWQYFLQDRSDAEYSQEQIDNLPVTAFYGQIEGAPRTVVLLGFADQTTEIPRLSWIAGGRQSFSTEYARIVTTSGLAMNLIAMSNIAEDPLRCIVRMPSRCASQWVRQIDMTGKGSAALTGTETLISEFEKFGPELMVLPNGDEKLVYRIEETGRFVFARQPFTNQFWIEPDGHVVKSKQTMMPHTNAIELTQLKWMGRDGN